LVQSLPSIKTHNMIAGYSNWNPPVNNIGPFKNLFKESRVINKYEDLENINILFLWGGSDISPSLYYEERIINSGPEAPTLRDLYEWELLRECYERKIPVVGICRGAQLCCVFAGGTLIQHVNNHGVTHNIVTFHDEEFEIPGSHHQMMNPYKVTHELLAWPKNHLSNIYEPDTYAANTLDKRLVKEPEVVYFPKTNSLAIQGHPEWASSKARCVEWCIEMIKEKCFANSESKGK